MSHYFKKNHGFTIIELLISITIVTVILTVVVFNQSIYTETAALTNLADEIGLTISQAQIYGVGVKELALGSSDFSASYGLTFSLLDSGSNSAYIYFADRNGNNYYDGDWSCPVGGVSECISKVNITRGNYIDALCWVKISGPDQCNNPKRIDISFTRPSIEAQFVLFNSAGQVFVPDDMKGVRIILKSPEGASRSIVVYKTGQVSISSSLP